jgi:hypothetical protein
MNRPLPYTTQYTPGRPVRTREGPSVEHGVFDSLYPNTIARSQVSKAVNFYMTPDGLLETRGGTQKLTDTAMGVIGALPEVHEFVARETDGTLTRRSMVKSGTVLYEYNTSTGIFDAKKTSLSTAKASMVNFVNATGAEVMLYADGSILLMYDGTTVTDISSNFTAGPGIDFPRYLYVKWNVVFASGDDTNPDVLFFCDPGSPNTAWPASGYLILEGGVDKITGLNEISDYVFVTALDSIHVIEGRSAATFAPIKVNSKVGCSSHWSIVNYGNNVYWANPAGFHVGTLRVLADEGMEVGYIGHGMQNTFNSISDGTEDEIEGAYHEGLHSIFWSFKTAGASYPDKLFVYSTARSKPELGSPPFGRDLRYVWAGYYEGIDFSSIGILKDSNNVAELYVVSSDGYVHKLHTGYKDARAVSSDTGTDVAYEIQTREETYGGTTRVQEFLPTLYQKHNSGFNVQFLVNRSELFPASAINITFKGNIPYWNDGADAGISSKWNNTVWSAKPILSARIVLKKKANTIIAIIKSDGSNTQEEGTWIGYDIKHQRISQKQGKAA